MTDFARPPHQNSHLNWHTLLMDLIKVGHLRAPIEANTKLDAQAQWEASQTLSLLVTLLVAGFAAVMSQVGGDGQASSPVWVALFGICALSALTRVGRSYRQAYVRACVTNGIDVDSAEDAYQNRYAD
jgi:hypothetical protein